MRTSLRTPGPRGFTLVEVAVVLFILAIVIAMAAAITRGVTAAQKRSLTATRMAGVDAALAQFVAQQKRLPCPADGTLTTGAAALGRELWAAGACTTLQANGVVPWQALGLSELEATDGWDRRLTYRVHPDFVRVSGMDMSACDPAGGDIVGTAVACTTPCTAATLAACTAPKKFLSGKGLRVRSLTGLLMDPTADPHTGAAYVVISHGESGGGGYLSGGVLGASASTDGDEEKKNYVTLPYDPANTYYLVDDTIADGAGAGHFDDLVSRPSVMGVISKAGLGPRAH